MGKRGALRGLDLLMLLQLFPALTYFVAGEGGTHEQPVILLHLSDLHISENADEVWYKFGSIREDLNTFTRSVIKSVSPDAVLITGDLTDSKDFKGAGEQDIREWEWYESFLEQLRISVGLAPNQVLDIRGNHDGFNAPMRRGDMGDHFNAFSSSGRLGYGSDRLILHVLFPARGDKNSKTLEPLSQWSHRVTRLNWNKNGVTEVKTVCPTAILFGVDASAEIGLKSPANFVGLLTTKDLEAASQVASDVKYLLRDINCTDKTPVISYGHFPLSTLSSVPKDFGWGAMSAVGALRHAFRSVHCMQGMAKIIAEFSTVYISGHLHAAFGERLHRLHSIPESKVLLTELETSAWKDDRRFRIMAIDSGCLSFSDYYYHTATSPIARKRSDWDQRKDTLWRTRYSSRGNETWGVTIGAEKSSKARVIDHISLITWPVDPRYAFCAIEKIRTPRHSPGFIRSVVFSLTNGRLVDENVTVSARVYRGNKILIEKALYRAGSRQSGGMSTYEGKDFSTFLHQAVCSRKDVKGITTAFKCFPSVSKVKVQVLVNATGGINEGTYISAISESRLANLRCIPRDHGAFCQVVPRSERDPIDLTFVEWFTLAVNWPNVVHRLHLFLYLFLVGFLLFSKLMMHRFSPWILKYASTTPESSIRLLIGILHSQKPMLYKLWGIFRLLCKRTFDLFLVWPLLSFPLMSSVSRVWRIMVRLCSACTFNRSKLLFYVTIILMQILYLTYLIVGPLFLADLLTGSPPAVIFHQGVFGYFHGEWLPVPTPDVLLFQAMHHIFCVMPLMFGISLLMSRRMCEALSQQHSSKKVTDPPDTLSVGLKQSYTVLDVAFGIFLLLINIKFVYIKSWKLMGSVSILFSPGFAWTIPLAVLLTSAKWNAYITVKHKVE